MTNLLPVTGRVVRSCAHPRRVDIEAKVFQVSRMYVLRCTWPRERHRLTCSAHSVQLAQEMRIRQSSRLVRRLRSGLETRRLDASCVQGTCYARRRTPPGADEGGDEPGWMVRLPC